MERRWCGGDGRGPGQVWPEVNVFLETVSQILLAPAVSSVTGRGGDSEKKRCPRCANSTVRMESVSEQLSLSLFSLSSLLALDHLFLKVERKETAQRLD